MYTLLVKYYMVIYMYIFIYSYLYRRIVIKINLPCVLHVFFSCVFLLLCNFCVGTPWNHSLLFFCSLYYLQIHDDIVYNYIYKSHE